MLLIKVAVSKEIHSIYNKHIISNMIVIYSNTINDIVSNSFFISGGIEEI